MKIRFPSKWSFLWAFRVLSKFFSSSACSSPNCLYWSLEDNCEYRLTNQAFVLRNRSPEQVEPSKLFSACEILSGKNLEFQPFYLTSKQSIEEKQFDLVRFGRESQHLKLATSGSLSKSHPKSWTLKATSSPLSSPHSATAPVTVARQCQDDPVQPTSTQPVNNQHKSSAVKLT